MSMGTARNLVILLAAGLAVAGCKKKEEPKGSAAGDAAASDSAAPGEATPDGAATAPDAGATGEAGGTPRPGGGMLAGLFGAVAAAPAAEAAAVPANKLDAEALTREALKGLLTGTGEGRFDRALQAAQLTAGLAAAPAAAGDPAAPASGPAASLCELLAPTVIACLGDEVADPNLPGEFTRECREELAGKSLAQLSAFQACLGNRGNCEAFVQCLEAADEVEEAVKPAPPVDALCESLVTGLFTCFAAELGEAIPEPEARSAVAECRTEVGAMDEAGRSALARCTDLADCSERMACISGAMAMNDGPGGNPLPGTDPPPPVGGDFCEQMVRRSMQCGGSDPATMGPEVLGPAMQSCREGMAQAESALPGILAAMEPCFSVPCAQMTECMSKAAEIAASQTLGGTPQPFVPPDGPPPPDDPTSVDIPDNIFGTPPDPRRVATLPPATQALCTEAGVRMEACWDTFVRVFGAEAGGGGTEAAMLAGLKAQVREGFTGLCLTAALEGGSTYQELQRAAPCFRLPCDQMVACIEALEAAE